jgi:hypothetical protein
VDKVENLLVDSYLSWIRATVSAERLGDDVTELTTPFLDRHNDHLQVYAESKGSDLFLLTDDGYILAELKSSGVERRGHRREELLTRILSSYGVAIQDSELQATASRRDLGQRLHNLIQAMLSLDDMFILSHENVGSVFFEDVAKFLDDRDVRYIPSTKFAGKSGLDHLMDFVIPKSRQAPERVVQVLNSARRDRVQNLLFTINDTRSARGQDTAYYALLNDKKKTVSAEIMRAFAEYSVRALPWSRREEVAEALAA